MLGRRFHLAGSLATDFSDPHPSHGGGAHLDGFSDPMWSLEIAKIERDEVELNVGHLES
jgi:hypothetical protein